MSDNKAKVSVWRKVRGVRKTHFSFGKLETFYSFINEHERWPRKQRKQEDSISRSSETYGLKDHVEVGTRNRSNTQHKAGSEHANHVMNSTSVRISAHSGYYICLNNSTNQKIKSSIVYLMTPRTKRIRKKDQVNTQKFMRYLLSGSISSM